MQRISRAALALLLLNLSLVGGELPCAHESQTMQHAPVMDHAAGMPHHSELPEKQSPPCDESASQCCDAVASCVVAGNPERGIAAAFPALQLALLPGIDPRHASAPHEVATPPPRA